MTNAYKNTKVHSGFAEDEDFAQKSRENKEIIENIFNHFRIIYLTEDMYQSNNYTHKDFDGICDLVMVELPEKKYGATVFRVEYNKTTLSASEIALATSSGVTFNNLANGFTIYGNEITIYY